MFVTYDIDSMADPMLILERRQEQGKVLKALKTFLRTGRVDKDAIDSIRDMVAREGNMKAQYIQENLRAEFAQDEQIEGSEITKLDLSNVEDKTIDDFIKFMKGMRK